MNLRIKVSAISAQIYSQKINPMSDISLKAKMSSSLKTSIVSQQKCPCNPSDSCFQYFSLIQSRVDQLTVPHC